jgi:L-amino acid N-acyltransferase YncA
VAVGVRQTGLISTAFTSNRLAQISGRLEDLVHPGANLTASARPSMVETRRRRRRRGGSVASGLVRVSGLAEALGLFSWSDEMEIRAMEPSDWPAVRGIFEQGVATRCATFEQRAPSWEGWDADHLPRHRLAAEDAGEVVGWAALSPVSSRPCYAGVAEDSVYVAPGSRGQGIGTSLLRRLCEAAEKAGIWTIQASIFPENEASIALHRSSGFRVVGVRERIGRLDGAWRDTVLLERRAQ